MTILAMNAVRPALYSRLKNDSILGGLVHESVYDVAPQRAILPYVVIGNGVQHGHPADGLLVTECQVEIHVWTAANSYKHALQILDRIYALLHLGALSLEAVEQVILRVEQSSVSMEEEGTAIRGTMRVIATVVEA